MIKPFLTTLSLSLVTLAAGGVSSASESGSLRDAGTAATPPSAGCSTTITPGLTAESAGSLSEPSDEASGSGGLRVPGAIILSPFEAYAPYRTDLPEAQARRPGAREKGSKTGARTASAKQ